VITIYLIEVRNNLVLPLERSCQKAKEDLKAPHRQGMKSASADAEFGKVSELLGKKTWSISAKWR